MKPVLSLAFILAIALVCFSSLASASIQGVQRMTQEQPKAHFVGTFAHFLQGQALPGQLSSIPHIKNSKVLLAADSTTSTNVPAGAVDSAKATAENAADSIFDQNGKIALTPVVGIVGGLLIVIGLSLVGFGNKLFKPILFIYGFILGGAIAAVSCGVAANNGTEIKMWVFWLAVVLSGLVLGAILSVLWRIGLFVLGAVMGIYVAFFIQLACSSFWTGTVSRGIVSLVFALIGGIMIQFEKFTMPALIFVTAFGGSYNTFIGIDFFANTGMFYIMQNPEKAASVTGKAWIGMVVGLFVLAAVGMYYQWSVVKKEGHRGLKQRDALRNVSNKQPVAAHSIPAAGPSAQVGYQKVDTQTGYNSLA
ncbi:hypothetical protein BJ741DRAFT_591761 [Chytriomyces cf. hyalinus JEL632]|nr:hypothetical protein BJ741DRAFT_591761 [Chytriomyces cf. hyalinus JEL632]